MNLVFVLALAATARAAAPVFAQDPLCAETQAQFRDTFDKARPLHLKYPQFRAIVGDQNRWFAAVTNEMKAICEADAKFALELVKKDRPALTGQCKPAAEAALADQEVLDHSEDSLKTLKRKYAVLLTKQSGDHDSLANIFARDYKRVDVDALDLWDVPRTAGCELEWLYPKVLLNTKPPFTGCPDAPPGVKLSDWDKKDAGLFAQLMSRYRLSLDYNTQRRDNALATAKASRARYEACVAQNPGTVDVLAKIKSTGATEKRPVPKGQSSVKGSDISGVEQDEAKQKK